MKVLLVNGNRTLQPVPVIPFGACLVAQAASGAGHDVRLLDLVFEKDCPGRLSRELVAWRPDVVGLSIRNIDTNDVRNPAVLVDEAAALVATVRTRSKAPMVLGGAALGVMARDILTRTRADWAVIGDGEVVFPQLLAALQAGGDPAEVPGVLDGDGRSSWDADSVPRCLPGHCTAEDFARWVDVRAYLARMASVPVQSKRGCPFDCVYCTYNLAEGREYRLHPPQRVVESIARLVSQGILDIEFVDNVFNSPYEHALAICRGLAAARLPARLQTLELNPRFLDDELMTAMEAAGFVGMGVTVESAADEVLAGLRKGYGSAEVRRAADLVAGHLIPCLWIFMLGGPGETEATLQETLEFAAERIRPTDTAFFQIGTRIYPGTPLDRLAREEGVLAAPANEMLAPVFYVSPQVPLDRVRTELAAATRKHMNFVMGDSLSLPLFQTVLRMAHGMGVRPPLWRHTPAVRRALKWMGLYRPMA
jgi:radical SAM superfamily enzyme YgiQ (UPF0313 family)